MKVNLENPMYDKVSCSMSIQGCLCVWRGREGMLLCFFHTQPDPVVWKEEDIYMVPAADEMALYTQLQDMLTLNLTRTSVK